VLSTAAIEVELPGGGRALFTSRSEGNLSSVGGLESERGSHNRELLRERIGVAALARGYQVHGSTVARVSSAPAGDREGAELAHADGQATALAGVGVMVLAADCLPVALGGRGGVAIVHAGWRGIAAGVLEQGAIALRELLGEDAIAAVIGPCAGPCCYEVGPEVHAALGAGSRPPFARTPWRAHPCGHTLTGAQAGERASERGTIDLRSIATARLSAAGVTDVRHVQACTICDRRFFSHRREGPSAGRQAGVAWLS